MPAVGSMDALDNSEIIEPQGSCEADGHEEAQLPSLAKSSREVGPAALRPLQLLDALVQLDGVFGALVEDMICDVEKAFEDAFSVGSTPPWPAMAS